MPSTSPRFALAGVLAMAVVTSGCTSHTAAPAATATPATTTPAPTTPAPTSTGPVPLTAAELAWLAAIPKFSAKIDKAFDQQNVYLTPTKLREYESLLRGCRRDLARRPPSTRLRPVYALVLKACGVYDKGAACFATAARIGTPIQGSADDRAFTRAIDCGFAAGGNGGIALGDAMNKGEEIRTETG